MQTIKLKEKIGYGFGDMASSMFWKIFGMYLLFFYTDVFGITAAAAGTMFLIARLWDSFFDLFVGLVADRTKTRWGRYRPYLLWFAIPFAVMGAFTFFVPGFGEVGKLVYAYITFSLMMIVYSMINVPYASLLGVMSSDPKERNVLSSYRMSFAFIGSFITFMLLQPLINKYAGAFDSTALSVPGKISTSPIGWVMGVATIGAICSILFFICFLWTRERVEAVNETENEKASVKQDLKNLWHNAPWWILVGTGLAALLFNAVRDGVAIYYFRDYVKVLYEMPGTGWDMTTIYFLTGQAANLVGVIVAPAISAKYGKKRTYMIAIGIAGILSAIFFYIPNQIHWILLMQALISLCAGYVLPLLWSMFADIVDDQEVKTNRRASGLIFSSSSMSQKLGWAVGAFLTGWVLAMFNYNPELAKLGLEQSAQTIFGQRMMISLLPAVCCIIAFFGMMFYPLTDKRVKENAEELEQRRQNK
jgi:GPH family glycoside/pentoside/hexuronide:cation symporter